MKLFVYDHCPYCIKARIIFGLKNAEVELVTLLNDDEETPISMIGQKMVPILQKDDGNFMAESLDIVDHIDSSFGEKSLIEINSNEELTNWILQSYDYLYELCMPRWAKSDLDEFRTASAVEYFTHKKEAYIGPFDVNLANSESLIQLANNHLVELNKILENRKYPKNNNSITLDDINLFASLRSLSIVKGIRYPKSVEQYRQKLSSISKIPLHDDLAI
jgi:glutaredoxin 2